MTDSADESLRRYVVGDAFAHGGVGAIHEAHDRALHRDLAYKVLLPDRTEGPQYRARFVREARLTAQLQHPNIVPVHDLGVDPNGALFFTMKRVHGRTLESVLRDLEREQSPTDSEFSLPRLLVMFGQMCQAVHYAHTRGVLHRDLKPANIMIGALGEVLVMDWGLAKRITPLEYADTGLFLPVSEDSAAQSASADLEALAEDDTGRLRALLREELPGEDDLLPTIAAPFSEPPRHHSSPRLDQLDSDWLGSTDPPGRDLLGREGLTAGIYETQDGRVLGTPPYMAPEQTRGRELDVRADVYALGTILYEILALRPAFRGGRAIRVMSKVATGRFKPPSHWAPNGRPVPAALERICLRAMALHRDDRHPTAWALFLAIESFLQGTEERRRREEAARAALEESRQHRVRWERARAELRGARGHATRLLAGLRASDPLELKRRVWAAEDRRDQLELKQERHRAAFEQCLRAALRHLPGYEPARQALAEHAWDRLQDAELRGDQRARVRHESELEALDDGTWSPLLRAPAILEVTCAAHAEVSIAPLREIDRRLVAPACHPLEVGTRHELEPGRYLLHVDGNGLAPLQLPVRAARGGRITLDLAPRAASEVPAGFVHIPGGRARIGGDLQAQRSLAATTVELPDFAIQTQPVTMAEYLVFLRDLEAEEPGAGWARAPRNEPDGGQLLVRDGDGTLQLPEVDDAGHRWDPDLAVMAVSFDDAVAYAEWLTVRDGRRYRLPTEAEWEVAARSPDGRIYPWGDRFVPGYALVLGTLEVAQPMPVGFAEQDINGFGIRDLGGGSRDWCDGWKTAQRKMRVQRGGAWWDRPERSRLASRSGWPAHSVYGDSGFRLVFSLPAEPAGPAVLTDPDDPRYGGLTDEHLPPV